MLKSIMYDNRVFLPYNIKKQNRAVFIENKTIGVFFALLRKEDKK